MSTRPGVRRPLCWTSQVTDFVILDYLLDCFQPDCLKLQSRALDQMIFFIPYSQQHVNCDTQGFHGYSNISWHLSSQTFVFLKCCRSNSLLTSLGTLPVRHKHLFLSPLKWSTWSQVTGFVFQIWSYSYFNVFLTILWTYWSTVDWKCQFMF